MARYLISLFVLLRALLTALQPVSLSCPAMLPRYLAPLFRSDISPRYAEFFTLFSDHQSSTARFFNT